MAHYAFLDENNIVVEVIVGKDEDDNTENWEEYYQNLRSLKCKRTSYNTIANQHIYGGTAFRGNYAGIGYTYDEVNDVFIPPKPYESWILDTNTYTWQPPTEKPDQNNNYYWDEDTESWIIQN